MTTTYADDLPASSWQRAESAELINAFRFLFNSGLTISRLKENAISGSIFRGKTESNVHGLAGRSMAWKFFLSPVPPLTSDVSDNPKPPLKELAQSRDRFVDVLSSVMRAPDGSYPEGFVLPGDMKPLEQPHSPQKMDWGKNNPLSLDEHNPWREWFTAMELRKSIYLDVERTFPDLDYFRNKDVQTQLSNILFVHASSYPAIGYRQGMHELLASIYIAVDYDSLDPLEPHSTETRDLYDYCNRNWVAADSWYLFEIVMAAVNPWYEWREPEPSASKAAQLEIQPYVSPIVTICNKMHGQYLRKVDPLLWEKMSDGGIEPQLYGIRWLRLLFTREFSLQEAMVLWDGIFAISTSLEIVPWVCVAMLVRIRNKIIPGDYSEMLTYLMRYPGNASGNHIALLLQQAVFFQQAPSATSGITAVAQNRDILNIPIQVPEPPPRPMRRQDRRTPVGERKEVAAPQSALPEFITKNILDKSESLGINRAFFNTVSEIRRNLSEIPGALARTASSASVTSLPALATPEIEPVEERPPWEPKSRFQLEGEMSALRNQQRKLATAMSWAVEVLAHGTDDLGTEKREALECLQYVRDVLSMGNVGPLDEERLVNEKERQRRHEEAAIAAAAAHHARLASEPTGSQQIKTMLSTRDSRPVTSLPRVAVRTSQTFSSATTPTPSMSAFHSPKPTSTFPSSSGATLPASSGSKSRPPLPPWQHVPLPQSPPSSVADRRKPKEIIAPRDYYAASAYPPPPTATATATKQTEPTTEVSLHSPTPALVFAPAKSPVTTSDPLGALR